MKDTDYDGANEYVIGTTANGIEVHGKCKPGEHDVVVDPKGMFECAKYAVLPPSGTGQSSIASAVPEHGMPCAGTRG